MTRNIGTDANIDQERLRQQMSHPAAPASGYEYLYLISGSAHGGLYLQDSGGRKIGPFITGSNSGATAPPQVNATDIANCVNWIDLDQETGTEGDLIGTLTDRSASANNATQATAGNKPILRFNVANGKKGAFFDGADDYLTYGTNIDIATNHTVLVVMAPMYRGGYSPVFQYKQQGIYQSIGGTPLWGIYRGGDGYCGVVEGGEPQVIGVHGSSNSAYDLIHNYLRRKGSNTNAFTAAATSYIGTDVLAAGSQVHSGYIFEIRAYNAKISDSDLQASLNWLLYKWRGIIRQ